MTVSGGLLERDGVTKAVAGLVEAVRGGQGGALFVVVKPAWARRPCWDAAVTWPRRPGCGWAWPWASD